MANKLKWTDWSSIDLRTRLDSNSGVIGPCRSCAVRDVPAGACRAGTRRSRTSELGFAAERWSVAFSRLTIDRLGRRGGGPGCRGRGGLDVADLGRSGLARRDRRQPSRHRRSPWPGRSPPDRSGGRGANRCRGGRGFPAGRNQRLRRAGAVSGGSRFGRVVVDGDDRFVGAESDGFGRSRSIRRHDHHPRPVRGRDGDGNPDNARSSGGALGQHRLARTRRSGHSAGARGTCCPPEHVRSTSAGTVDTGNSIDYRQHRYRQHRLQPRRARTQRSRPQLTRHPT